MVRSMLHINQDCMAGCDVQLLADMETDHWLPSGMAQGLESSSCWVIMTDNSFSASSNTGLSKAFSVPGIAISCRMSLPE